MTDCLCFELPNDNRTKVILKILEQYDADYLKFNYKSFFSSGPNKIKFILFQPHQLISDEILEYVKSEYGEEDYIYQSSFQLTDKERNFLIDLTLK